MAIVHILRMESRQNGNGLKEAEGGQQQSLNKCLRPNIQSVERPTEIGQEFNVTSGLRETFVLTSGEELVFVILVRHFTRKEKVCNQS